MKYMIFSNKKIFFTMWNGLAFLTRRVWIWDLLKSDLDPGNDCHRCTRPDLVSILSLIFYVTGPKKLGHFTSTLIPLIKRSSFLNPSEHKEVGEIQTRKRMTTTTLMGFMNKMGAKNFSMKTWTQPSQQKTKKISFKKVTKAYLFHLHMGFRDKYSFTSWA